MEQFFSNLSDVCIHPFFGWSPLPSGVDITTVALFDSHNRTFARLGAGDAEKWAHQNGYELATVEQHQEAHNVGVHIEPYTLPDKELRTQECKRLGVGQLTQAQEQSFRINNMMVKDWAIRHDTEVWLRINALNFKGWDAKSPVDNCGKYWVRREANAPVGRARIFGWWLKKGATDQDFASYGVRRNIWGVIQAPGYPHDLNYADYGTCVKVVRKS